LEITRRVATQATPAGCRTITVKGQTETITVKVLSDEPAGIGSGGRVKEVDETVGGRSVHSWSVSFYGPGYLGGFGVTGDGTTRAEVLSQARSAYQKAGTVLG
jgi:hypothetical protein